jgi:drug/metabolite transporter (DMT)-like permease
LFKGINKHFLLLHLVVFIWGFSPILGRFITADAWQLVWYRILITVLVMILYLAVTKQSLAVSSKQFWKLCGIGTVIMIHWLLFYGAIKVSNVSVTLVAFSTGTLFSSIIEPILFKRAIRAYEVIIGLIIIGAIALIFSIETEYWLGIVLGIAAAFTSSLFGVFNGIMSRQLRSGVISFYELSAALLGLTLFLLVSGGFRPGFFTLDQDSLIGIGLYRISVYCVGEPFQTHQPLHHCADREPGNCVRHHLGHFVLQ